MTDMINTALLFVMGFGAAKVLDAVVEGDPIRGFWHGIPVGIAIAIFTYRRRTTN
jgi:hypothetical protein